MKSILVIRGNTIELVYLELVFQKKRAYRDFPGGPVVKTASTAGGAGLTPGGGTGVLHPSRHNQKKEW